MSVNQITVNWETKKRYLELVPSANGHDLEADLAKGIAVENHAPVKNERGFVHGVIHGAPIDVAEFFPFRRDDDRLAILSG